MIKAYRINQLFECKLHGNVLAEVYFQIEKEPKSFLHPFRNMDSAVAYLDKEARDWFLGCLENFIRHKAHIITGKHPDQEQALQNCQAALEYFHKWPTNKIAAKFLERMKHFEAILPNSLNPSQQSSISDLNELKTFCEEFLKFKPYQDEKRVSN